MDVNKLRAVRTRFSQLKGCDPRDLSLIDEFIIDYSQLKHEYNQLIADQTNEDLDDDEDYEEYEYPDKDY